MDDGYELYELYQRGTALLEAGHNHQATIPLALAACLQPGRRDYRFYRDRARARAAGA
jgi:hypothetical protein